MEKCNICDHSKLIKVDFNNLVLRTDSKDKALHDYNSFICQNCGVLNQHPQMDERQVSDYYNSSYRQTGFKFHTKNFTIDLPLKFEQTGISFQRFYHFNKIIKKMELLLKNKPILDYGSYQGAFLYACKKAYNAYTIAYDYNEEGLKFSSKYLELDEVKKTDNIYTDSFNKRPFICTLIHVFEHLARPNEFLTHIHKNILEEEGYIYIEVPDINGNHFSDPTHCFTYGKESLKYVLEKNNFEVMHIETNNIFGKTDNSLPRKKLQLNLHCLAKKVEKSEFIKDVNIGFKIYKKTKSMHSNIFNKFLMDRFKNIVRDILDFMFLMVSKIISLFSNELSIYIYENYKIYLKKLIKKIKK